MRYEQKLEMLVKFHEEKAQEYRGAIKVLLELDKEQASLTGPGKLTKAMKMRAHAKPAGDEHGAAAAGHSNGNGNGHERLRGKHLSAFLLQMADETEANPIPYFMDKLREIGKPVKDARSITGPLAMLVKNGKMRKLTSGYRVTKAGLDYATEIKRMFEPQESAPAE